MKLFKNPVFAVVLCLLIIICSTCLNARFKMEKRYDRLCDRLYDEVLDFADANGLSSLKSDAHAAAAAGDYHALISAYGAYSAQGFNDTEDVDDSIRDFNKFLRLTQHFPASLFVNWFDLSF